MRCTNSKVVAFALGTLLAACGEGGHPPDEEANSTPRALTACGSDAIAAPPQFAWTYHAAGPGNPVPYYSGTLEVGEADFVIGGRTLTTRAYRQAGAEFSIPGPTITMVPGNKYVLHFANTLPFQEIDHTRHNVFKDANIANIHTHGLHISGESPGDDVTRAFEGGFGGDFVYDIPADHMGGTFWYHAHHHGSSFLQVSGGMFGLLVIDDAGDGIPANVANMTERQLVLGFLDPRAAGTGGDRLMSGTLRPTWTLNGRVGGSLCMPQNEWQHWRVLVADRDAEAKTVEVGANCEVMLLARDGVWRTTAPKAIPSRAMRLTGASRADFAVRCSNDSDIRVDGNVVARVAVSGAANTSVHPFAADGSSTWSAIRPDYLRDLRGETRFNTETVRMTRRTFNGRPFDENVPTFRLPIGDVQQWNIDGGDRHPFHLHVYHVQSMNCASGGGGRDGGGRGGDDGRGGGGGGGFRNHDHDGDGDSDESGGGGAANADPGFEDGEFYDVINSDCQIRFDLNPATTTTFEGRTIMHCHILRHEDQGVMGWLDVVGGEGPPTFPADINHTFGAHYSLDGQPHDPGGVHPLWRSEAQ
jgi:suppressor of ftsI